MQQEDQGQWRNVKVEKARGVKPGIYIFIRQTRQIKQKNMQALSCMQIKRLCINKSGKGSMSPMIGQIL